MSDYRFMSEIPKQSEGPIPGQAMVKNHAGGYVWEADGRKMLERFLVLGTTHNGFYANKRQMTAEAMAILVPMIESAPEEVGAVIVELSVGNRCVSNSPSLFLAAYMAAHKDGKVSKVGVRLIPTVCRTAAYLQEFVGYYRGMRKSSPRSMRTAIARWFVTGRDTKDVVYQALKYQRRSGQSMKEIIRSFHVKPDGNLAALFAWILGREWEPLFLGEIAGRAVESPEAGMSYRLSYGQLVNIELAKAADDPKVLQRMIVENRLTREMVDGLPSFKKDESGAWQALAKGMPIHALLRNLGILSAKGALVSEVREALASLTNREFLEKTRIHPMEILKASAAYARGSAIKGSTSWRVDPGIVKQLEFGFQASVEAMEPFGCDVVIGVDSSGSMGYDTSGMLGSLTPIACGSAYAWMLARQVVKGGKQVRVLAFDTGIREVTSECLGMSFTEFVAVMASYRGGGTDCSLPFQWVKKHSDLSPGLVVTFTDSESWAGDHPAVQVIEARKRVPGMRVVYSTLEATTAVLSAPGDPLSMDVTGFDATVCDVIAKFSRGEF